jgi:hypothetical protein
MHAHESTNDASIMALQGMMYDDEVVWDGDVGRCPPDAVDRHIWIGNAESLVHWKPSSGTLGDRKSFPANFLNRIESCRRVEQEWRRANSFAAYWKWHN